MEKVYLVYPGLGKTYAAKCNKNILDVRLSHFQNLNTANLSEEYLEKIKGQPMEMKLNPDFPQNLIDFVKNGLAQDKIVVMALKQTNIDFLIENNIDFDFVVPAEDKLEQLKNDYISRGNTLEVAERNINNVLKSIDDIKKYNKEIIYLHNNEYLLDLFSK